MAVCCLTTPHHHCSCDPRRFPVGFVLHQYDAPGQAAAKCSVPRPVAAQPVDDPPDRHARPVLRGKAGEREHNLSVASCASQDQPPCFQVAYRRRRCRFRRLRQLRDDLKPDNGEDSVRRIPLLRAFTLFHASQIDGVPDYIPPTIEETPWRAPEAAEIIVANSRAVNRYGGERAFYSPSTDHIQVPQQPAFPTSAGFCSTPSS